MKIFDFFIFFRQQTHFLGIRGGMLTMTNLDLSNHPLQDFWNFPPTFPQYFQIFSQISIFGEFRYLCLKFGTSSINIHGEKCFQSCTLFGSFFNFHIVQCTRFGLTPLCNLWYTLAFHIPFHTGKRGILVFYQ